MQTIYPHYVDASAILSLFGSPRKPKSLADYWEQHANFSVIQPYVEAVKQKSAKAFQELNDEIQHETIQCIGLRHLCADSMPLLERHQSAGAAIELGDACQLLILKYNLAYRFGGVTLDTKLLTCNPALVSAAKSEGIRDELLVYFEA